jgi:proteic killer suppression protein
MALDTNSETHYYQVVIRSFKARESELIFKREFSKTLPHGIQPRARRKLVMLHNARTLNDLRLPPSNRLEALSGSRRGQHSIRINDQWRICFVWSKGDAYKVEIVDYH